MDDVASCPETNETEVQWFAGPAYEHHSINPLDLSTTLPFPPDCPERQNP